MSNRVNPTGKRDQPTTYQIRIKGHLGQEWSDRFEGMTIVWEGNGDTLLTGPVVDQAALYGLLRRVRDLCIPLISVTSIESRPGDEAEDPS